ncbi:MAG: hypothetical protein ACO2O1_01280 [Candidatus Caldarchaeales archaeon]|jgi:hypothetical protein
MQIDKNPKLSFSGYDKPEEGEKRHHRDSQDLEQLKKEKIQQLVE